jgi:hypothetical protein
MYISSVRGGGLADFRDLCFHVLDGWDGQLVHGNETRCFARCDALAQRQPGVNETVGGGHRTGFVAVAIADVGTCCHTHGLRNGRDGGDALGNSRRFSGLLFA